MAEFRIKVRDHIYREYLIEADSAEEAEDRFCEGGTFTKLKEEEVLGEVDEVEEYTRG